MNFYVDVVVPGPWWTILTYSSPCALKEGSRVKVPLARSFRIGFVHSSFSEEKGNRSSISGIKNISTVLDENPVVPPDIWDLAKWAGNAFLCGMGEALATMFPAPFLKGDELQGRDENDQGRELYIDSFFTEHTVTVYRTGFHDRKAVYIDNMAKNSGNLLIFPEFSQARNFFDELPEDLRGRSVLWPSTGGKKLWDTWVDVYRGDHDIVIGSQACVFAPLPHITCFMLEDESNNSYRMTKYPYFNLRSIVAKRAALLKAKLVLAGRMPSSRVFRQFSPSCVDTPSRGRLHLIDMKMAPAPEVTGVETPFRISEKVLEETERSLSEGGLGIWILDRKSYAGQIFCESCGFILNCEKCGGIMSWHAGKGILKCNVCGELKDLPEVCPHCRGNLLNGKRPGLEALLEIAEKIYEGRAPVHLWHADYPSGKKERNSLISSLKNGGVVVGSRASLALLDFLKTGSVCWIDGDSESMKSLYNSRFTAFSMMWESLWRGKDFPDRHVVIQSRTPGKTWQRTLFSGWEKFWEMELPERKEFEFPPYGYLAEINVPEKIRTSFEKGLVKSNYDYYQLTDSDETFWVKVNSLKIFRERIGSFFGIGNSSKGYPKIRLWMD